MQVLARKGSRGRRDGAARSIPAARAALAPQGGTRPQQRAGHPGSGGTGESDEKTEQEWEGDKVEGADLLQEPLLVPSSRSAPGEERDAGLGPRMEPSPSAPSHPPALSEPLPPPEGAGGERAKPPERNKIPQARRENNGVIINKPPSESDEIARRSFPINSKLCNIQVLGKAVVL